MAQSTSATILSSTFPAEHPVISHQTTPTLKSPLKRKAHADTSFLLTRAARRPKQQHESPVPRDEPVDPMPHRPFNIPEAGSILSIIRDNPRTRLFVPPLLWTPEHVNLLGFGFLVKEVPRGKKLDRPVPLDLQPPSDGKDVAKGFITIHEHAAHAAKSLSEPCSVEARVAAASDILAACNFQYKG